MQVHWWKEGKFFSKRILLNPLYLLIRVVTIIELSTKMRLEQVLSLLPKDMWKRVKENINLKLKNHYFQKNKSKQVKHSLPDKDYGPDAHYIPLELNSDIYKQKENEFLGNLKKVKMKF